MPLTNPASLEKLTINAYQDSKRTKSIGVFVVMFNATAFTVKHQNAFQKLQGINTSGRQARYSHSLPRQFSLSLILDGTGVIDEVGAQQSVAEQIKTFLNLCFYINGKIHAPAYLKIQSTALNNFDCCLQSVDIKYTLFDNTGNPLRAELATVFIEDLDPEKRERQDGKTSPDLTHSRTVKEGDTLPLLTKEIYGSTAYYLRVADYNKLDNFRNLKPGQELFFPPLPTKRS